MGIASGSRIMLIDGNEKNIEDVREGEDVLSYDFENERTVFSRITKIAPFSGNGIMLATAGKDITVSPGQGFILFDGRKKRADELQVNDGILGFDFFSGREEKIMENRSAGENVFYEICADGFKNAVVNGLIILC